MESILTITTKDDSTRARTGILSLPHGDVETPAFMPVGTNGTVKALHHSTVERIGYRLILGNTYHLYLRPGTDVIERYGDLHRFSSWGHNILTDSGGFQVFSLSAFRKIKKEGVTFRSHIDGSYHHLSPERVVKIQQILGSDIMMCLDVCTPPDIPYKKAVEALTITMDWAKRSIIQRSVCDSHYRGNLFGIVQGNFFKDLRMQSALAITELDFPGIAIGGLSVGEEFNVFQDTLAHTRTYLPEDKPLYVMGIGTPEYIFEAVEQGIDLFDCVFATRTARNGAVFTSQGMIQLKKARHEFDTGPIEEGCTCTACSTYSRGYLRHMFKSNEILGPMLATEHNLQFLYDLMTAIRKSIREQRFKEFKASFLSSFRKSDA